jgi:hypothetical protein
MPVKTKLKSVKFTNAWSQSRASSLGWMNEDLVVRQIWENEIPRALKASEFILVFFSRNSVAKRGYVQREMKMALDA